MTKPLPDGWRLALLGEICAPQKASATPADLAGPYVAMEHLETGRPFTMHHTAGAAIRSSKSRFRAGDVLYGKLRPYLDKAALANFDGICSTELLVLRPIHADPAFLAARLHAADLLDHAIATTTGVNHPRTSWPAMAAFEIPLPPLAEQRRIARFLSRLHHAASLAHHRASLLQRLKSATLAHLFHPDRTVRWPELPLAECADVRQGAAKGRKTHGTATDAAYLRVANVQDGHADLSEIKTMTFSVDELPRYLLKRGDVLFTEGGDFDKLGRGFVWNAQIEPCAHQNHIFAVRTDPSKLLPAFLSFESQSPHGKRYFLSVAHKTTNLACINSQKLKAFPVLLPDLNQQHAIVKPIGNADAAAAAARARASLLDRLFSASLAALMSGALRLPDSIPWLEAQDEAAHG